VLGHGQNDFLYREFEFFGGALNDADIGLVRHQPIEVCICQAGFVQHGAGCGFEHTHSKFEHALAVHFQYWVAQNLAVLHMTGDAQQAHMLAIGMDIGGQNAKIF